MCVQAPADSLNWDRSAAQVCLSWRAAESLNWDRSPGPSMFVPLFGPIRASPAPPPGTGSRVTEGPWERSDVSWASQLHNSPLKFVIKVFRFREKLKIL